MGVRSTSRVYLSVYRLTVYGETPSMCFRTLRITSVNFPEQVGWRGAFLSPSVRQAALSQCKTFTEAVQLNASVTQLTKAEYKETAGSARRLFQYHRLPDKSPALFLWIFGNVYLSKNCYMFIARFLAEPRLGNTTSWVLDTCGAV